jgi:hypothetical protein
MRMNLKKIGIGFIFVERGTTVKNHIAKRCNMVIL